MYIYNVTVSVDDSLEEEWLDWMKKEHIPEVMKTGYFSKNKIYKVLLNKEGNSVSYSIQYHFDTMKDLQLYQSQHAPMLQKKHSDKYKEGCIAFRSVLEEMN